MRPKVTITSPRHNNIIVASWMEKDVNIAKQKGRAFCGKGHRVTVTVGEEIIMQETK